MKFPLHRRDRLLCSSLPKTALRITKLIAFILTTACLQVSAFSYAQDITLSEKNVSLEKIFNDIKKQSEYRFWYESKLLKNTKKVTIEVKNASIKHVLNLCLANQPLTYNIIKKVIVIKRKNTTPDVILPTSPPTDTLNGKIINEQGAPVPGATIRIKDTQVATISDDNGNFTLENVPENATMVISSIGYAPKEYKLDGGNNIAIQLAATVAHLDSLAVTVSTGYQKIPKERATGSFDFIDNKLLNRSVGINILDRLKGVTSGLLFDHTSGNELGISIRGRSTIFASTRPLVVVDNFPYEGEINAINPNDIKSITILKDAAATSIWGARAGNGVIVITTKQGHYQQPLQVDFHSSVTVAEKPDFSSLPVMSASDFIDVETFLFKKGYYNSDINSSKRLALTPVVDLLNKVETGQLSAKEAESQIDQLRHQDVRNDFSRYLYQKAVQQQYALSLSGGGANQRYYFSGGYDHNLGSLIGNRYKRYTLQASNTYSLFHQKLQLTTGVHWQQSISDNNGISPGSIVPGSRTSLYPYARLADEQGHPLIIAKYNQDYIDTAGNGRLLDWHYRPLDEPGYADNTLTRANLRLNIGLKYKILDGLSLHIKYHYGKQSGDTRNLHSLQSYYTRNYINTFSSINTSTGEVTYAVPMGAILDIRNEHATAQNLRGQLNYSAKWHNRHQITAIAGAEVGRRDATSKGFRYYGYDPKHETTVPVDLVNEYDTYITGKGTRIVDGQGSSYLQDRNVSVYANAAYTYDRRLTVSASARKDASNLFGVRANQKWVPLWSAGVAWTISRESFYHTSWLPYLKLRATYGYSGNVDKTVSALLTSKYVVNNVYNAPVSLLKNPPNPGLRWERVAQTNVALDFGTKANRISGSIEYFWKKGSNLMGYAPLTSVTGLTEYKGNTSDMKGEGLDVNLETHNISGVFNWTTNWLFSYARDEVTRYKVKTGTNYSYILGAGNPIVGKPVSALYSFRWAGLDPETGDPQGYLGGKVSKDYAAIINSMDKSEMFYHGPRTPTIFGGIRNTLFWKQLSFSFNITYKFGSYFRRESVDYGDLFTGWSPGHADYAARWQQPGDEQKTFVPSMIYPSDLNRGDFYRYSAVLVDRGDEVRLQDIRLSYTLNARQSHNLPISGLEAFLYAGNLGILWRANPDGIDPEANPSGYYTLPAPRTFSLGLNIHF